MTKWNYYLQGTDIIVRNDHKPLAKFLNGKNANNKVNRWGLELATYNITFEWISRVKNKAKLNRNLLPTTPQYHQILHQTFPQSLVQHPKLLQQAQCKLYSRCKRLIHSANAYLNDYSMEKHNNMK